ncbi:hypothetical protein Pryu01_01670 [Paraliobacillus ryukyuensis]|uniref:Competence CoiA-like predicted nuclease n=1 Tax=Paraliobacillus ryukyuensis TaxID=200904 RepID=A0A366E733_9BACI|nr:competence protein CoiA family protein [Paraliobacillus ryukyuensis]RBO98186.1 competence CoiA-like predicted nuclease [Paraliobacillus ryukyuensis]
MLKALSSEGESYVLASLTKNQIKLLKLKKNITFYCPSCHEKVIIKSGEKRVPHFAHQASSSCAFAKGEGSYHEQGKLDLFHWFFNQGYHVELEKYLPAIKQRPDLFITSTNKKIAIEYQCAQIGAKEILTRTRGYQHLGIVPIWILGGNRLKRKQNEKLRLTSVDHYFIHQLSNHLPTAMFYYCPHTKQLAIIHNIYFTNLTYATGSIRFHPLSNIRFTNIFRLQHVSQPIYTFWIQEKKRWRLRLNQHPNSDERHWLQWLYLHRLVPSQLPSYIHLPTISQWKMTIPSWNWQSRLCIDLLMKQKTFTVRECSQFLIRYEQNANQFPLISPTHSPVLEYLNQLFYLDIVKRTTSNLYHWNTDFQPHATIEQALAADKIILSKLGKISKMKHEF